MTLESSHWNVTVLGQGLAGTTLAWWLRWAGVRVLVIDRTSPVTASRIAAGLMTPVTGQALAKAWRYDQLWPAAVEFYNHVEQQLHRRFLQRTGMVRLLADEEEVATFTRRRAAGEYGDLIHVERPRLNAEWFEDRYGGFEMKLAGRLDVPGFLGASREFFKADCAFIENEIDLNSDVRLDGSRVHFARLGISTDRVIFCQGFDGSVNPWFRDVEFRPAKGEILTIRIPGLTESRVIHSGVWLVPLGSSVFKVGSTYDWNQLDATPTEAGRKEIEAKLKQFLRLPYEVLDHQSAVRPIHRNQLPIIGLHPLHPQLGYFNGLGSKGAMQAPFFGRQFVDYLYGDGRIDLEVDLNAKTNWHSLGPITLPTDLRQDFVHRQQKPRRQRPLTELAQEAVRQVIQPGDLTVDATAGNGHDTYFLAVKVGPQGRVFAFDIQEAAIEKTAHRLADAGLNNVQLVHGDHSQMREHIPTEHHGQVAAVMMNLGYLPGGDKQITTRGDSTTAAITTAVDLLRPHGLLTVMAYTGHDGGADEAGIVESLLNELSKTAFNVSRIDSQPGKSAAPVLFLAKKI